MYVRASIVEQLPDPLTPLFAEMIDGSVARSLQKLMNEFLGGDVIRDGDVGLPTVNGYAYYRYTRAGMMRVSCGWDRLPGALHRAESAAGWSGGGTTRTRATGPSSPSGRPADRAAR